MALRGASGVTIVGPAKAHSVQKKGLRTGSQKVQGPASAPKSSKGSLSEKRGSATIITPQKHGNGNGAMNTK